MRTLILSFLAAFASFIQEGLGATPTVGSWEMPGKDAAHTGYYPATVGPNEFTPAWSRSFNYALNPVVVSGTRVFFTANYRAVTDMAGALDVQTGQTVWRLPASAGSEYRMGLPAYANGRLYFPTTEGNDDGKLWCVDARDGTVNSRQDFDTSYGSSLVPTIADGSIWLSAGYGGWQLLKFRAESTSIPVGVSLSGDGYWTPSYSDGLVYTWTNDIFSVLDGTTGAWQWQREYQDGESSTGFRQTVAVSGGKAFLGGSSHIRAIDLDARQQIWVASGTFAGAPVVDPATVYAVSGSLVKSYDAATGVEAAPYIAGAILRAEPIVTKDVVIVSGQTSTYVFDRVSRELRQTLPVGGSLCYAAGRLYVTSLPDGTGQGKISTFVVNLTEPETTPSPTPSPSPSPSPSATPWPTPSPAPSPTPLSLPAPPTETTGSAWIDAQESEHIAYFLFASPARIERYDLAQKSWLEPLALGGDAHAFTVDEDGIYVSFGKMVSKYGLDGAGPIDLLEIDDDVKSLFTDNDIIYLVSGRYIRSANKGSGAILHFRDYFSAPSAIAIARDRNTFYLGTPEFSSIALDDEGTLRVENSGHYVDSHVFMRRIFVAPDESRVIDSNGVSYDAGGLQVDGSLNGALADLAFDGEEPVVLRGNNILTYSSAYLETGRLSLPGTPKKIFVHDGVAFVFYPAGERGVWGLDLPLDAVPPAQPAPPVDPNGLAFAPDDIEFGNGIAYLLSGGNQSIFRWSVAEKKYLDSIPLYEPGLRLALDGESGRLYVGYPSGRISYFADAVPGPEQNFAACLLPVTDLTAVGEFLFARASNLVRQEYSTFDVMGKELSVRYSGEDAPEFVWNPTTRKIYGVSDNLYGTDIDTEGYIRHYQGSAYGAAGGIRSPVRVSPDGFTLLLGSGAFFDAVSLYPRWYGTEPFKDGAWRGSRFYSLQEIGSNTQWQGWSENYSSRVVAGTIEGAALRLFGWDEGLLAITSARGIPKFTLLEMTGVPDPSEPPIEGTAIALSGDLSFGDVAYNRSAIRELVIKNRGTLPLQVNGISHDLSAFSGDYRGTLAPGASTNVTITFSPSFESDFPGQLAVVSNALSGTFTKSETGRGIWGPPVPIYQGPSRSIALTGDLDFGKVAPGTSVTRTLTIRNTGNSPLSVSGITHPHAAFQGSFSGTIAADSSQNVVITFTPAAYRAYSGRLKILSDASGGTAFIAERGIGSRKPDTTTSVRVLEVSDHLDFGSVQLKKTVRRTLTLTNRGTAPISIYGLTHPSKSFTGNFRGTIPAGKSRTVTITFRPLEKGFQGGIIGISSNATSETEIATEGGSGFVYGEF